MANITIKNIIIPHKIKRDETYWNSMKISIKNHYDNDLKNNINEYNESLNSTKEIFEINKEFKKKNPSHVSNVSDNYIINCIRMIEERYVDVNDYVKQEDILTSSAGLAELEEHQKKKNGEMVKKVDELNKIMDIYNYVDSFLFNVLDNYDDKMNKKIQEYNAIIFMFEERIIDLEIKKTTELNINLELIEEEIKKMFESIKMGHNIICKFIDNCKEKNI
jgi:hypothetical protein